MNPSLGRKLRALRPARMVGRPRRSQAHRQAGPVTLSPVVRALVPAASFATPSPIPCSPAHDAAVALPTVVPDTDVEPLAAAEALDLDEVDRIRASHAVARRISTSRPAGARLYSSRGRASTSLRRLPGRPARADRSAGATRTRRASGRPPLARHGVAVQQQGHGRGTERVEDQAGRPS